MPINTGMKKPAWIEKIFLVFASFFLTLLVLFSIFEVFPHLPARLGLTRIYYYALKERYATDDRLVLRIKPFYTYQGKFYGDISGLFSRSSFTPLPYEAHYDKDGFRNTPTEGQADIVVFGDSFLEVGINNDDIFAAHLEKISGLSTANYGSGWYGPFQYLESLKRYGILRRPKFALFCFFEGNDLKDISEYLDWQKGGSYYHFHLYSGNFFRRFFLAVKDTLTVASKLFIRRWDPRRAEIRLGDKTFHTVFVHPVDSRNKEALTQSVEIQKLGEILKEFKKVCLAQGIQPVVMFIPTAAHIYLPYAKLPAVSIEGAEEQKRNRFELEKVVQKKVIETKIPWLNLVDDFEKAAQSGKFLYYETDTHWNTEGRKLAAEKITALLKERLRQTA